MVKIVILSFLLGLIVWNQAFSETVGIIHANSVEKRDLDAAIWSVHDSMKKILNQFDVTPCRREKIYSFNNTKIDNYYFCGSKDSGHWDLRDDQDNEIGWLSLAVFPNCREAMNMALSERPFSEDGVLTSQNTTIEKEGSTFFLSSRLGDRTTREMPIHTAMRQGVLLVNITWRDRGLALGRTRQKKLLNKIIDVVLSDCKQKDYTEELHRIRRRNREQRLLREDPSFGMPVHIQNLYSEHVYVEETSKTSNVFIHPNKMWNRPSWEWFDQFVLKRHQKKSDYMWNRYGGEVSLEMPEAKGSKCYCQVFLAHAVTEYHAKRFMEGFLFDRIPLNVMVRQQRIGCYKKNPHLVGEYDLALKPQLDGYGALIPNSEESDISFVRNNTAVRVVADRPDVSVLWIARKIDEELIAAGKGKPPTWTSPPTKKKGARNVPATSGKPIWRPAVKVPAASGG